ncbi:MAG: hypothetical protein JSV29_04305 [Candidatus Bathyarchaeota archaeon]|nr:MAG: hypothetical protein JSV29_04305 [Candidatus Bathyarchaeota archaeon]
MENKELAELKTVYDELWSDAKIMIKDMNNSITMVFLFGVVMFAMFTIEMGTAIEMYSKIASGSARALDYFYLVATAFGSVVTVVAGVTMLRWYYKLKNRYAKLIQLEKNLED